MSRIGNRKLEIPAGVTVSEENGIVTVKGPKGELSTKLAANVNVKIEDNSLEVLRDSDEHKPMHGTMNALINNMIIGVTEEFTRKLEVNGVGYRAQKQGKKLVLTLGYSHPVEVEEPEGITFEVPSPNEIIVKGINKEVVGQTAMVIRSKRPPEVYRGKGIKYAEETIRRKEGKAGKK